MLNATEQQNLVTRLNRVEGQIRGIRRMVQEPRACQEILQQLAAAEAALNRVSLAILKFHVDTCVPEGIVPRATSSSAASWRSSSISSIASPSNHYECLNHSLPLFG